MKLFDQIKARAKAREFEAFNPLYLACHNANTAKVPDAVVADAAIRYEKNGWGAALNVTNLFDKDYVKGYQGLFTCGYGDQRTITLKLSKSW